MVHSWKESEKSIAGAVNFAQNAGLNWLRSRSLLVSDLGVTSHLSGKCEFFYWVLLIVSILKNLNRRTGSKNRIVVMSKDN